MRGRMNHQRARFLRCFISIAIAAIWAIHAFPKDDNSGKGILNPELNMKLKNIDGKWINIAELNVHGPVVISFWATWCAPCKKELSALNDLYLKYKDSNLRVICVNQDSQKSLCKVKSYIKSKKYEFVVLLDTDKSFFRRFNSGGIPFTVVFDSKGNKIYTHLGYMPGDEKSLEKVIETIISTDYGK